MNVNSEQNDSSEIEYIDSGRLKKSFKCGHSGCNATFSKALKLTIHIRQHTGERPYKCDHDGCNKSYTNTSHLKRHFQTHNIVKQSFECPKCGQMISNQHNLKRHYERVHTKDTPFSCEECGLKFNKEQKYKEHEAMHKGVALYKCTICSRQCTTLRNFKKHETSHKQKKEYPCTVTNCSEVFDKWSLLCKHKNSKHTSEYKCKDCEKIFLNKTQLKTHSVIHLDDRSILPCPHEKCPRFYFFKRNLDHHVRTSHLGKKYHCDICNIELSSKQKIIEHISKIHLAKKKRKKTLNKSERRRRKDAGAIKKSMLTKLTGLELPREIETELLTRKTRIEISHENSVQPLDISHEGIEVVGQILTNGVNDVTNNCSNNLSAPVIHQTERMDQSPIQI